jgi:hypothetical protein
MKFHAPSSDQIFLGQDQALGRRACLPSSGSLPRIRIAGDRAAVAWEATASLRAGAAIRFFFDRRGALNSLQFTGDDYFADKDVCSIVLEVPNSALGSKKIGLLHRTLVPADGSSWVQAERGARPAQLILVLGLPDAERDAYLTGEPADDSRFIAGFRDRGADR